MNRMLKKQTMQSIEGKRKTSAIFSTYIMLKKFLKAWLGQTETGLQKKTVLIFFTILINKQFKIFYRIFEFYFKVI